MASTASEYLAEMIQEDDGDEFWAQVYDIAGTDWVFPGTELPTWLREAAFESLDQTFSFDYWTDVPQVTRDAVLATLRDGIRGGLSIRELAEKIKEDRGSGYAEYRATNTARTETNFASNSGARVAVQQLAEETGLDVRLRWGSVFGSTSRPNHEAMDDKTTDEDGMFHFEAQDGNTYLIPCPGAPELPAEDRCQCQCYTVSSFVDEELGYGGETSFSGGIMKYDPAQPRNEEGEWTDNGAGSGRIAIAPELLSEQPKKQGINKITRDEYDGESAVSATALTDQLSTITSTLKDRFPHLQKLEIRELYLQNASGVRNADGKIQQGTLGTYRPKDRAIAIAANAKRMAASNNVTLGKFSATSGLVGTYLHEVGHAVYGHHTKWADKVQWKEVERGNQKRISGYAKTSSEEAFAEAFSAFTHPQYANTLPESVHKYFESLLTHTQ